MTLTINNTDTTTTSSTNSIDVLNQVDNTMKMYLIPARLSFCEGRATLDMVKMDGYKYRLAPFYMGWLVEVPCWWGDTLGLIEWF